MKKLKLTLLASSVVLAAALLSACGSNQSSSSGTSTKKLKAGNFDVAYQNPDKAIKGGDLKIAYQSDSPMKAEWLAPLSDDATFGSMSSPGGGQDGLFFTNSSFKYINGGPANVSLDKDADRKSVV